ncbi:hypothetical protein N8T08_005777 [Aspergillus melleus]|uniref:Uncharacterized protein n=1 Tax=Aspergillus melleus TaxID=138277 RepID=A0ACC3B296_9EURO|nr:hypothetical protein N8T08_005777 [Aspergillus melleus]
MKIHSLLLLALAGLAVGVPSRIPYNAVHTGPLNARFDVVTFAAPIGTAPGHRRAEHVILEEL